MQKIEITICDGVDEAIAKGYTYDPPNYTKVNIQKAIVVRRGTVDGNSTVDLIMQDDKGNKYVALITSNLLKSIPAFKD